MEYRVIDRNNWQRKEYFEHYLKEVPVILGLCPKLKRLFRHAEGSISDRPVLSHMGTKTPQRRHAALSAGKSCINLPLRPLPWGGSGLRSPAPGGSRCL